MFSNKSQFSRKSLPPFRYLKDIFRRRSSLKILGIVVGLGISSAFVISCIIILGEQNAGNGGNGDDIFSADTYLPWEGGAEYYSQWTNGPRSDQYFFPIAVWLQSPYNAVAYKAIGINTFVGLWEGPTASQLSDLSTDQMPVVCDQNRVGLTDENKNIITAWLHQDEPDNAQYNDSSGGYDPPITPEEVFHRYNDMEANDSTRPVFLNLGQGVAWDEWWGRGVRTNHPEDYAQYAFGADILSYDIYPMNLDVSQGWAEWNIVELEKVSQNLSYVPHGIDRLRQWSEYKKPVWIALECTNFNDNPHSPTPITVKAEVWMSLIHGARGIVYFCHIFSPSFIEAGLLSNATMSAAVSAINAQITMLAPILNTQSVGNGVTISSDSSVPLDTMLKRFDDYTFLFAVSMRPGPTVASFSLRDFPILASAEVLGEGRTITVQNGEFQDIFTGYSVHIYKIR